MAKYNSAQAGPFMIGGYNLLGYQTAITDKIEAITEETHTLGDAWVENTFTGVKRWTLTQQGFYDDVANGNHDALEANLATNKVLVFGVEGNTTGARYYGASGALQVNYERVVSRGELHKANAEYVGVGALEQGRIIRELTGSAATGYGNSNSNVASGGNYYDFGASNTSGVAAHLQISGMTGASATGVLVELYHSPDAAVWSSYTGGAFAQTTAAPSAQRISSTSPIQRYVIERHTAGTGFPTLATFLVGVAPR